MGWVVIEKGKIMANGIVSQEATERMAQDMADFSSPAEADTWPLIEVKMDRLDWEFVIVCLRFRARQSGGDTKERAEFTADSIQDVLDGAR